MSKNHITLEQAQNALDIAELLYSGDDVEYAINTMAASITEQLNHKNPLLMPVMVGGLILAGKLIPQLNFPAQIDYIHATRYRGGLNGNELHWIKKPEKPLQDKTVLLIDDILDEGITLAAIIDYCYEAGADKVLTAVLAKKILKRDPPVMNADFTGLNVPDRYVFGYGMDYHEYHRNLNGIYGI